MNMRRCGVVLLSLVAVGLLSGCFLFANRPPEAAFTIVYNVDPADLMLIELDASASSDPDEDEIVSYSWVFVDDVTIISPMEETKTVSVPTMRIRYDVEGVYTVTLLVRDALGNSSDPVTQTVTLPNVPVGPTE